MKSQHLDSDIHILKFFPVVEVTPPSVKLAESAIADRFLVSLRDLAPQLMALKICKRVSEALGDLVRAGSFGAR